MNPEFDVPPPVAPPAVAAAAPTAKRWHSIAAAPFPELAILILAGVLRLWRPAYHSIWFDEAVSLRWARSDAAWIWSQTFPLQQDKHPPGYYLFLHVWSNLLAVFGQDHNDALLRTSGALLGVLAVVGVLLLARALSGRRVALCAGALAALSPALVWYSQELRMFQPAATAAVWTAYLLVAAWRADLAWVRLLLWLGMIAALVAGVYSYLFSAFLYPAAGLALLLLLTSERRAAGERMWGRFAEGVAALAVATALFLPLARNAWLVNGAESTPGTAFAGFAEALWLQVRVFTIWRPGWQGVLETAVLTLAAALALVGLTARRRAPRAGAADRGMLWIWLFVPLLIGGLLLATTASVFGEDRYFLFVAPFALWAVGRGMVALAESARRPVRVVGASAGLALGIAFVAALVPLWSPSHARENWRAAVAQMVDESMALPSLRTAAISHIDYTRLPAEWYLRQRLTFDALPLFYPFGGALSPDQIDSVIAPPLAGVEEAGFDTLWLLQSHLEGMDDGRLVEQWLAARYPLMTEAFPAGIRQTAYAIRSRYTALPAEVAALGSGRIDAPLAPGIQLAACEVTTPTRAAKDTSLHPPSGWVHVRLWWELEAATSENYRAQVRVVNSEGVWGEILERSGDTMAMLPTSTWTVGEFIRHEVDVNLNPVTPAGEFAVTVALLDANGAAVTAPVNCGAVAIE